MKPIPYGKQSIDEQDIAAVVEILKSDFLTQGPSIKAFEEEFAKYIGSTYAVAVSNGTAALHLSALALGVNESSRVITTPITFSASANCIRYCGGNVDFVDIDSQTGLIDINAVRNLLEKSDEGRYQGIIPVDYTGNPVDLEALRILADEYGLWILEDACHAPGAYFTSLNKAQEYCGNGNYAELSIFSFHPVKHIACGEGGMVTTNDESLYKKLLMLRTHGITKDPDLLSNNDGGWYYEMQDLGFNYRLSDIQAALGLSQLRKADNNIEIRRSIASKYDQAFKNLEGLQILNKKDSDGHAYHLYVILAKDRKGLYDYLKEKNIHPQVHYIPVHTLPYYQKLGWKNGDFPKAEAFYSQCLSLPMYPTLSSDEQDYVINNVINFLDQ